MTTPTLERPTVHVAAMLEPTLAEQLARAAVTADRSVSAEIRHALRLHLLGTSVPQVTSPTAYEKRRIT